MTSRVDDTLSPSTNGEQLEDTPASDASSGGYLVTPDSDQQPVVSVVMPTLNEEGGIEECITRIVTALENAELPGEIIVSDSSTDRTPEIARELGARVVEPDEPGYGYAYRFGFRYVRGEYVVMGDADTTYDFEQIPALLEPVRNGEADICMGSRLEGEIKPGAMPALHQYVGNPLLTKFLNVFYDAGVSDAHSGFRVFTKDALDRMELTSDGMEFASEMVMEAGARDLRIAEVPIVYHEREGEATLDSFRDGWRHVRFMLVNAPGYLFTGPAIGLGVVGAILLIASLFNRTVGSIYFGTLTSITGSLLTILGFQLLSLGIASSIATNPIRTSQGPVTGWVKDSFQLEHGATFGVCGFCLASVFAASAVWDLLVNGAWSQNVPTVMLTFTALVLSVQLVFYSFFISMLVDRS